MNWQNQWCPLHLQLKLELDNFTGQNILHDELKILLKILRRHYSLICFTEVWTQQKYMGANTETDTVGPQTIKRGTKSAHVEATRLERGRQKLVHNDIYSACHLFFLMTRLMSDFCWNRKSRTTDWNWQ